MKRVASDAAGLEAAAAVLLAGGVALIPTDTVYGLAAHPDFPDAVARLYTIKGREAGKPIALLAADAAAVERFFGAAPGMGADIGDLTVHWPGALTLVLPKADGYEGIRVPDHDWTRRLLARCGGVLRVTSANMSGQRPATDAPAALAALGLSADLLVDDGVSPGGEASSVVQVMPDGTRRLLRAGALELAL
jgi:L-threonylcarbamoyladenylate synthase